MEMMNAGKNVSQDDMSIFLNPTVNLSVALSATALIIGAGVLAGYSLPQGGQDHGDRGHAQ